MPRKEKAYHFIYKTTCLVTGKFYIGMHSTNNLEDGYLGSGKRLKYSIRKYGIENHIREILEFCSNRSQLFNREKEIVNETLLEDSSCINLMVGGHGGYGFTQEILDKISNSLKSKWEEKEYRDKILSINKERWKDPSYRENISNKMKDRWKDENFRLSMISKSKLQTHTEETRKKIGEANSISQAGERNSQFGTCWVTDGNTPIKIKREELNHYISIGYKPGRKIKI